MSNTPMTVKVGRVDCAVDMENPQNIVVDYVYRTPNFQTTFKITFSKNQVVVWSEREDQYPVTSTIKTLPKGIEFEHKELFSDWLHGDNAVTNLSKKINYENAQNLKDKQAVRYSALDIALKAMEALTPEQQKILSVVQQQIMRDAARDLKVHEVQI